MNRLLMVTLPRGVRHAPVDKAMQEQPRHLSFPHQRSTDTYEEKVLRGTVPTNPASARGRFSPS